MTMLAERVEVVIGVDTHRDTHTGAVVIAATGAVVDQATVCAGQRGYAELVAMADRFRRRGRGPWKAREAMAADSLGSSSSVASS